MEQESFEQDDIADLLNQDYVCVKVDREERPDIDSVYMSVCQAVNGQGGWPLTIIMTPDCRPFFAGTYIPPRAGYGRVGLEELLAAVTKQWETNQETLISSAGQIEAYLKEQERITVSADLELEVIQQAFHQFTSGFDQEHGGFGSAPKFPTPHNLMFLMEYGVREKAAKAWSMVETTLEQMYRGGIFDHIGGGFSRYSTDERWQVPHFEKMLYDNALLVMAYTKAYAITGRKLYEWVVRKTLSYVEAELTDGEGGFYCGQDADSDGVEGKYYVFTPQEIRKLLDESRGMNFCQQYGITESGNFEGKSIPNRLGNKDYENTGAEKECRILYEYRMNRTLLHKDDKILVSWNGWMICALARAGAVFGEKKYLDLAVGAEAFISRTLIKNGRLLVRFRDGDAAGEGKLDDYACYIQGLLELYRVTFEVDYLKRAISWAEIMIEQFFDEEHGGFYLYAEDGEQLIVRTKETYDGAMPSGNSVAAMVLQQLYQITGEAVWQGVLEKQIRYLAGAMNGYPSGHSYALLTMMNMLYPTKELVCTLSPDYSQEMQQNLIAKLADLTETVPGLSVVVKTRENEQKLEQSVPYTRNYPVPESGQLFYLCSGSQCMPPVSEFSELQIQE